MHDILKQLMNTHSSEPGPPSIKNVSIENMYIFEGEGEDTVFYVIGNAHLPTYLEDTVILRHLDLSRYHVEFNLSPQ